MTNAPVPENIKSLERPQKSLWTYYIISSILTGPGIIISLPYLYFRYYTLRYRFDEEGIHMRVGILFRREVNLTYARIQDIHLRSNLIQRWLGLANVQIQTASGSTGAEMVIEGFKEFDAIRDFLYTRMRGYQSHQSTPAPTQTTHDSTLGNTVPPADPNAEMVTLLLSIRDELRRTRELLEPARKSIDTDSPPTSPADHV